MNEQRRPDLKLFQSLVQKSSVTGSEAEIQKYILGYFNLIGMNNTSVFMQDENVVVHLKGKDSNKAMLFIPHVDTVTVGKEWSRDPLGAEIETVVGEERLYGRGACDTKAGVFAAMETATTLFQEQQEGKELPCDAFFVFAVGEETDGHGANSFGRWFEEYFGKTYKELSAIFLEPTNLEVKYGHRGDLVFQVKAKSDSEITGLERMIELLKLSYRQSEIWAHNQKEELLGATLLNATNIRPIIVDKPVSADTSHGKRIRITSKGENTHAALTGDGETNQLAINKLVQFLCKIDPQIIPAAIRTQETSTNTTPNQIELDLEIPLGIDEEQIRSLAEKFKVECNLNLNPEQYLPSSDEITANIDIRTILDHHEEARTIFNQLAAEYGIEVTELPDSLPAVTPPDSPIVSAYKRAIEGIIRPIVPGIFPAASDMGILKGLGGIFEKIQAVIFGAGDLAMAHKIDEFVPIAQVLKSIDILYKWYYEWNTN